MQNQAHETRNVTSGCRQRSRRQRRGWVNTQARAANSLTQSCEEELHTKQVSHFLLVGLPRRVHRPVRRREEGRDTEAHVTPSPPKTKVTLRDNTITPSNSYWLGGMSRFSLLSVCHSLLTLSLSSTHSLTCHSYVVYRYGTCTWGRPGGRLCCAEW